MKRIHLTDSTTVPLFVAVFLMFTGGSTLVGSAIYITGRFTAIETAHAATVQVDKSQQKEIDSQHDQLMNQSDMLVEIKQRTTRIETLVEEIAKKK